MRRFSPMARRRRIAQALAGIAAMLVLGGSALVLPVEAHGKDIDVTVATLLPDPDQPLVRLVRARATYAGDGEPVNGATVVLTSVRSDGTPGFPEQVLTQVGDDDGLYVGEVVFDRFGTWDMHLTVKAALDQGEGSVTFSADVRTGPSNPDLEAAQQAESERVARLQVQLGFHWWPDIVTIAMRIVHSLAGLAYFVITGLVLGLAWFGIPSRYPDFPRRLGRVFRPVAATSLGVLLLAGLYSAAFDAPVAFPGIYDIPTMRRLALGDAYLVAFLIKVVLFIGLIVQASRIHRMLRRWVDSPGSTASDAIIASLRRTTLLNAVAGVVVIVDVAVLIYLHYLSHLGAFIPAP